MNIPLLFLINFYFYLFNCINQDIDFIKSINPVVSLRINEENLPMTTQEKFPEKYFNQIVDHSSDLKKIYKQRYFVNDQHYKPGGPAFLFIGGESKISPTWVWWGQLAQAAKIHNGIIFALEHRYYGKSFPTANLSTNNLKFLSSEQALEDIAYFISNPPLSEISNKYSDNSMYPSRWIVAGGSYPGNLAAWSRLLYPELIYGAIASSAPVYAKENFYEYDLQVSKSLERHGGPLCAEYFHEVFSLIDEELLSGVSSRSYNLKKMFNMHNLTNELFAMNLDFISGLVQYNNPSTTNLVKQFCATLNLNARGESKLKEFADIVKRYNIVDGLKKALQLAEDESLPDENSLWRQWLYQCCTEFGYWQVAPPLGLKASRSRAATAKDWDKLFCADVYGPEYRNGPLTKNTNKHYQGRKNKQTRIFWVNGELDPWRPLSVVSKPRHHPRPYVITNASHAMDLGATNSKDWHELAKAKRLTQKHIAKWVNQSHDMRYSLLHYSFDFLFSNSIILIVSTLSVVLYGLIHILF